MAKLTKPVLEFLATVVPCVVAIVATAAAGLPLNNFMLVTFCLVLLAARYLFTWPHERWNISAASEEARPFVSSVLLYHRFSVIFLAVIAAVSAASGAALRYCPAWATAGAHDLMTKESAATHPRLRSIPSAQCQHIEAAVKGTDSGAVKEIDSGAYFVVLAASDTRLEPAASVIEELLAMVNTPILSLLSVVLALVVVILFLMIFFELLGTERYKLTPKS